MAVQNRKYNYTPVGNLADIIIQYIRYKRSLGFSYGIEEGVLFRFSLLSHNYPSSSKEIPSGLLQEWCTRRKGEKASTHSSRVNTILQFCRYAGQYGYRVDFPDLPKIKVEKYQPYIFTKEEVAHIFKVADSLEPYPGSLRHIQAPVLYRLLYSCGLRATEAASIKCGDVDLFNGVIAIYEAKFRKDRLVPLSSSMTEVLKTYFFRYRKNALPEDYLFPAKYSDSLTRKNIYSWFRLILKKAGIHHLGRGLGPREHDIRHTFCVHALQSMQEARIDLYAGLPLLSVYIGHKSIKETQHYLRLTAEFYPGILQILIDSGCDIVPNEKEGLHETN
ncbi:MAG: integrase [Calditrichaeota bacterium]|nr:MAG: integrase [Calditrichota bacterium]